MSMKGRLGMYVAMAAMLGGAGVMGGSGTTRQTPRPQPRKLSPEDEQKLLEERMEKFILSLKQLNEERLLKFPKWKVFKVNEIPVIAFSQKNANRDVNHLLQESGVTFKES